MSPDSDGKLNYAVDGELAQAKALNSGRIQADGGYVVMTAKSADDVLGTELPRPHGQPRSRSVSCQPLYGCGFRRHRRDHQPRKVVMPSGRAASQGGPECEAYRSGSARPPWFRRIPSERADPRGFF